VACLPINRWLAARALASGPGAD